MSRAFSRLHRPELPPIPDKPRRCKRWTPVMHELADVIGERAALVLCDALGGLELTVPRRWQPGSPVPRTVGEEAAQAIADLMCGTRLAVPCAKQAIVVARCQPILAEARTGAISLAEAAWRAHTSQKTIRGWLAEAGDTASPRDRFERGLAFRLRQFEMEL
ncbi:MAG: hypothetical protein RQ833_07430 [Sphingomonadaceae bacterium]|nr:hypothetical protein [Sphingomonadaceae bacterium]